MTDPSRPGEPPPPDEPGATGEGGGCRGPGGRATQAAAGTGAAGSATGRASVPEPPAGADLAPEPPAGRDAAPEPAADPESAAPVVRRGWQRLVPRRPWRWLGGIAALVALGSLGVGVLVVWLTRHPDRPAPSPSGADPSSGAGPSSGPDPTPSGGTPWTPGGRPTVGARPTGTGGGTAQGVGCDPGGCDSGGCDPGGRACDSGCTSAGDDCGRQLDRSCTAPSGCGSAGSGPDCGGTGPDCGSSGGDCSGTGHTLLVALLQPGLPYLHRTVTDPHPNLVVRNGTLVFGARDPLPRNETGPLRRLPARAGVAAIRAYQRISPALPTRCRYAPSCARYGLAAIQRYGLLTGARLALLRIHRCTADVPPGTADPLPA